MGCMNTVLQNSPNPQPTVELHNNGNISYKWQWYDSPVNKWQEYEERFSKQLNKAYNDNVNTFKFKFDTIEYKIDFNELTMTKFDPNENINTSVSIRKILVSYKWQYSSNNEWNDYDERFSKQLNEAYANNTNTFKFKFDNIEYKIDFNTMIMMKLKHNITMSIRRVPSGNETIQVVRQPIQVIQPSAVSVPQEVVVYQPQAQPQAQPQIVVYQQQQKVFQKHDGNESNDKSMMLKLLQKWNLEQYYNSFQETGWEDVSMWYVLIKQEHDDILNSIFKLKSGHKIKFIKYVNEELIGNVSAQKEGAGHGNQITHQ